MKFSIHFITKDEFTPKNYEDKLGKLISEIKEITDNKFKINLNGEVVGPTLVIEYYFVNTIVLNFHFKFYEHNYYMLELIKQAYEFIDKKYIEQKNKTGFRIEMDELNNNTEFITSGLNAQMFIEKIEYRLDFRNHIKYENFNFDRLIEELKINMGLMFDSILTFSEAQNKWGLGVSTLRKSQQDGRFKEGEIRKSGGTWLVTYEAMKRLYGEAKSE